MFHYLYHLYFLDVTTIVVLHWFVRALDILCSLAWRSWSCDHNIVDLTKFQQGKIDLVLNSVCHSVDGREVLIFMTEAHFRNQLHRLLRDRRNNRGRYLCRQNFLFFISTSISCSAARTFNNLILNLFKLSPVAMLVNKVKMLQFGSVYAHARNLSWKDLYPPCALMW